MPANGANEVSRNPRDLFVSDTRTRSHQPRPLAPPSETAFGVDDLSGDPGGVVGAEPRDELCGVVRLAPAALRHPRPRIDLGEIARVGRAGVDRVDGDVP